MSLYVCTACSEQIPSQKVRLQCQVCPNYHQCTNCYVLSQVAGNHTAQHQIHLHRLSGFAESIIPPPLVTAQSSTITESVQNINQGPTYGDKPLPNPTASVSSEYGQIPTSSAHAQPSTSSEYGQMGWNAEYGRSSYAPPPYNIPDQAIESTPRSSLTASTTSNPAAVMTQAAPMNVPATQSSTVGQPSVQRMASTHSVASNQTASSNPNQWQSLFNGTSPNPMFNALCNAFFWHVDSQHREYIDPEALSGFLDVLGIDIQRNVWKSNLRHNPPNRPEDKADVALRQQFELLNIGYILKPRARKAGDGVIEVADAFSNLFSSKSKPPNNKSIVSGATMPCMTRKGFLDFLGFEILLDPSRGWVSLKRGMRRYNIWPEYDEMPRHVLPDNALPSIVEQANNAIQQAAYQNDVAARQETLANEMAMLQNQARARQVSGQSQHVNMGDGAYLVDDRGRYQRF